MQHDYSVTKQLKGQNKVKIHEVKTPYMHTELLQKKKYMTCRNKSSLSILELHKVTKMGGQCELKIYKEKKAVHLILCLH